MSHFSRRSMLKGAAGLAGLAAMSRVSPSFAQTAPDKTTLLVIFLEGGYNSLFASADSFLGSGDFGVSAGNVKQLANGLAVDMPTFGTMPQYALDHMASVGVRHGLTAHEAAQPQMVTMGTRSSLLMLARDLGGDAAIKAAVVGSKMPEGPRPAEGDVSLQGITDMKATIVALGGSVGDPTVPNRNIATEAMVGSSTMSKRGLTRSPKSLRTVNDGFTTGVDALRKQGLALDYNALSQAYGIAATTTGVNNFRTQMVAADLMVMAGANVIFAADGGWDTHGDTNGANVRNMMGTRILPPLNTFLQRNLNQPGKNVMVAIIGDFARSLPGSDHQSNLTATVIGKNVKPGTTGKVAANVGLPAGTPSIAGFWAYLAAAAKAPTTLFGANPHTSILV